MGLVLAVVTAVPYVYGYAAQPHDQVFLGFFYLGDDANTYLAKMRQGWEGAWSWQNRYTTETSPAAYLFMFWLVLGHIAALLHLPLIVVFHLARIAAAFALMAAAWAFISHFIEEAAARRFAFFFCAIGLGMGYVIQALGHPVLFGKHILNGGMDIGEGRKEPCNPLLVVFTAANLGIGWIVVDEVGGE